MTSKQLALLIGGLVPAIGLGVAAIWQKLSGHYGIATGPFLIISGLVISLVGTVFLFLERDTAVTWNAVGLTVLFALFWAVSSGAISYTLRKLGGSISQLVPLYNTNTLVASLLIISGGVLASRSSLP